MKSLFAAGSMMLALASPALAQNQNSPSVDANGVSVNDQTRAASTMSKDINSPYNQTDPRVKAKGAAGGGGKPSSAMAAGGGNPGSKPPTKIQSH